MRKIAVVYATYDGINNCTSGVGTLTQSFIHSFEEVSKHYKDKNNTILEPHFIAIALNQDSSNFNAGSVSITKQIAEKLNGTLSFVLNNSNGIENFGNINNWKAASQGGANKIADLAQKYEEIIVYVIDVPFMHIPYYFEKQRSAFPNLKIKYLIVPHSDELSLNPENPDIQRVGWEASIIKYANVNPDIYIAKTSNFHINHLIAEYSINKDTIVNMQSGLNPNSDRFKPIRKDEISNLLQIRGIPTDKNIIFSVGRAEWYKGFDLLINAFAQLDLKDTHLVIISADYKTRQSYNPILKELLKETDITCTPIFETDFDLPSIICQWPKTKLVVQLSRHEPFGLVPEEVRLWGIKNGPVILASNAEGYREQIDDGKDGFLTDLISIKEIAYKINAILNYDPTSIKRIKKMGIKRFKNDYDYRISIYNSIQHLITGAEPKINSIADFKKTLTYDNLF